MDSMTTQYFDGRQLRLIRCSIDEPHCHVYKVKFFYHENENGWLDRLEITEDACIPLIEDCDEHAKKCTDGQAEHHGECSCQNP